MHLILFILFVGILLNAGEEDHTCSCSRARLPRRLPRRFRSSSVMLAFVWPVGALPAPRRGISRRSRRYIVYAVSRHRRSLRPSSVMRLLNVGEEEKTHGSQHRSRLVGFPRRRRRPRPERIASHPPSKRKTSSRLCALSPGIALGDSLTGAPPADLSRAPLYRRMS